MRLLCAILRPRLEGCLITCLVVPPSFLHLLLLGFGMGLRPRSLGWSRLLCAILRPRLEGCLMTCLVVPPNFLHLLLLDLGIKLRRRSRGWSRLLCVCRRHCIVSFQFAVLFEHLPHCCRSVLLAMYGCTSARIYRKTSLGSYPSRS